LKRSPRPTIHHRHYGGTGLGLAISAELIENDGWRHLGGSEMGHGSRFHFTARFELQKNPVLRPIAPVSLKNLSVLVVDDNATNRKILEEILLKWEMAPTVVESGEAALAELERTLAWGRPFSLVLLDANMPNTDGLTVATRIKKKPLLTSRIILMLSPPAKSKKAARCRDWGSRPF